MKENLEGLNRLSRRSKKRLRIQRVTLKGNIIDIPYDVITSVKFEKRLATIKFEASVLVGSKRLRMIHRVVSSEIGNEGVVQAFPKRKVEDLVQAVVNEYPKTIDSLLLQSVNSLVA